MFNPHPYDDPNAVNRPELSKGVVDSIITGTKESAGHITDLILDKLESGSNNVILALDGYIGARFEETVNLVSQNLRLKSVGVNAFNFSTVLKPGDQLDDELSENLKEDREKDPILLYGKLFQGAYEDLFDEEKLVLFEKNIKEFKNSAKREVFIVHGLGCAIQNFRPYYDLLCYFDVTPKEVILRARKGAFANLGDHIAKPLRALLRRCYYIDFEVAGHLRWELIRENAIDFYMASNKPEDQQDLIPRRFFHAIMSSLALYPFRCKPVYLEGVWGGHYIKKLRNLPKSMLNCAWVFDLIPLEVSIVVEAGSHMLELPFFTFVQKEGEALMGAECVQSSEAIFPSASITMIHITAVETCPSRSIPVIRTMWKITTSMEDRTKAIMWLPQGMGQRRISALTRMPIPQRSSKKSKYQRKRLLQSTIRNISIM